jgi:large subunit ribosomal protein L10
MSKFVKDLHVQHLSKEFAGVDDVLVVNLIGMDAVASTRLRLDLRKKGIHLRVVPNALAQKVFGAKGVSRCDTLFAGESAVVWGGEGIVELAREIADWTKKIEKFRIKGGLVDGQTVDSTTVDELSKLPSRKELIGQVIGLLLAPAASVIAMLNGPGGAILNQLGTISERTEQNG